MILQFQNIKLTRHSGTETNQEEKLILGVFSMVMKCNVSREYSKAWVLGPED